MKIFWRIFDRKMVFLVFLVIFLGITMMVLGPRETLDVKAYYSGDQARALLGRFDAQESQRYFLNELFDFVLICSYTCALFLGFQRVYPGRKILSGLALAPGTCDFIETGHILYALVRPGPAFFYDWLGFATLAKWAFGIVAILTLAFGIFRLRASAATEK